MVGGGRPMTDHVGFFPSGVRPPVLQMIAFIEEHREAWGVEAVRHVLPIAPST